MKQTHHLLFLFMAVLWSLPSCNPECESASQANITMTPNIVIPNSQFLLKSNPTEFLQDREILIDALDGSGDKIALDSEFDDQLNGVIAQMPPNVDNNRPIYVEDPDCSGSFIYVNDLQVKPREFFFSSDLFLVPPIPLVIVPSPPPPPPTIITNAWITPYDRAYCIWFVPQYDADFNELKELRPFVPGEDKMRTNLNPPNDFLVGSREFTVCGETSLRPQTDINPVSGIIDRENNYISISIDRTSKGLGIEHFTGQFISKESVPDNEDWRFGGGCDSRNDPADHYMLLTSVETGQQLLMIKAFPTLE